MLKEKKCKGLGIALGYGCGELVPVSLYGKPNRKYGLGKEPCRCYHNWLVNSEEGNKILSKTTILAKNKVQKKIKKENREKTRQQKIDLLSPDQYRAKYVQPIINKIARLIDYGNPCIATGNFEGKMAGGHYTSVGSNRTICLNLHNIFIQSFHSNSWNGGDDKRYRNSLEQTFGIKYLEFIESLKAHRPIQLRKDDLISIKNKAQKIALKLEKEKKIRSPKDRIDMRNYVNRELGIYDQEYSFYNG